MDGPVNLLFDPPGAAITCSSDEFLCSDAARYTGLTFSTAAAWPTANKAFYYPFIVPVPVVVKQVSWLNGGTVNGNVDFGVYDVAGAKSISLGSTAMSGANAIQVGNLTDTTINAGYYYFAMASSSGTATFFRVAPPALLLRAFGVLEQASAFALPSTATFAVMTAAYVPFMSLNLAAVV